MTLQSRTKSGDSSEDRSPSAVFQLVGRAARVKSLVIAIMMSSFFNWSHRAKYRQLTTSTVFVQHTYHEKTKISQAYEIAYIPIIRPNIQDNNASLMYISL